MNIKKDTDFLNYSPPNRLTPKVIENTIKKNLTKRSLSPFLLRKIHDNSFIIYNRDLSPSQMHQKDTALENQCKLPFIFPNKKPDNPLKTFQKEFKNMLDEANHRKMQKIDLKIMNFSEQMERLIAQSQKTTRDQTKLTERIIEKANEKHEGKMGIFYMKKFEVKEIEGEFRRLARKMAVKTRKNAKK